MNRTNYSFSEKEIFTLLFRKKTCPYCGSSKLSRITVKKFKGKGKSVIESMNFSSQIDIYQGNFVYQCTKCKKKFSLQSIVDLNNSKDKKRSKANTFFVIQSIIMILIILSIGISSNNIYIIIIFIPSIIIYYYITLFFTNNN
ncbi:MAG: hypothetical protein N4A50_02735 [Vallitalea sp.]|jgi:transcription elongation factor Elf1|nr:hypothetical protein [Vallitalea sp.]